MCGRFTNKANSKRIRQMIESYENGQTLDEVGQNFGGISKERVRQLFDDVGYKRRKQTVSRKFIESNKARGEKRRKNLPRQSLERMYSEEKQSIKKIARFFDCPDSRVWNNLIRYGIPTRTLSESMQWLIKNPQLTKEVLRQNYIIEDKTTAEIAGKYNCAQITIKRRLAKFGIRKNPLRN